MTAWSYQSSDRLSFARFEVLLPLLHPSRAISVLFDSWSGPSVNVALLRGLNWQGLQLLLAISWGAIISLVLGMPEPRRVCSSQGPWALSCSLTLLCLPGKAPALYQRSRSAPWVPCCVPHLLNGSAKCTHQSLESQEVFPSLFPKEYLLRISARWESWCCMACLCHLT